MGNAHSNKKHDCSKLKSSLHLTIQRLQFLQRKKTEEATKERVQVADHLKDKKTENARTKVENIIRKDFTVEAYEILELFCKLLISRFPVIQEIRELDPSIAEAVSTVCWAAPRIGHEIAEMKQIRKQFEKRYGPDFVEKAVSDSFSDLVPEKVNAKLIQKLTASSPSQDIIEKYLIVIAKHYSIEYTSALITKTN